MKRFLFEKTLAPQMYSLITPDAILGGNGMAAVTPMFSRMFSRIVTRAKIYYKGDLQMTDITRKFIYLKIERNKNICMLPLSR